MRLGYVPAGTARRAAQRRYRGAERGAARGRVTVVQVLLNLGHGGMETMAVSLARGLDPQRFRSVIVALDAGGEHEEALRQSGIESYVLGGRRFWSPAFHWEFAALLRKLDAAVVHTHHFSPLLHSVLAIRLARVPRVVHTEHSYQYLEPRGDYRRMLRWMGAATDAFVLVAQSMQAFYRDRVRVGSGRLRVIPNGIDTDIYKPSTEGVAQKRQRWGVPPDAYLVGTAGRFFPEKDYATLIRGFRTFAASHPKAHLAMIGDGPERPSLEALAGERVHFLGWRTDLKEILPALDVFALSSKSEGLPLVALEALACGIPVVATPVGDLPEVVANGAAGVLFSVGDAAALARALSLLADGARRAALGRAGRERVLHRYSQTAMVDGYTRAYDGLEVA
ncbi:MAG: glycosyltransferase [Gemmatimonadales bacterium]